LPVLRALAFAAALALAGSAGAEVAFVGFHDGRWSLFEAGASGDPPRSVRPGLTFDASAPALSPDGERVAFEVPGQGILVCPLRGEGRCESVKTELGWPVRPTWNPATGELVFVRYVADSSGEDSDVLVASADLGEIRPLVRHTGNQDSPDVSPDGRLLVYDSAQTVSLQRGAVHVVRNLWVVDLETGTVRPLVPAAAQDMQPDVSPDGRWVAFASNRSGGFEIWVVGIDGEGLRRVTSGPGSKIWPAWSPDGGSILYTRTAEGRSELWTTSADGSAAEPYRPFGAGSDMQLRDPDWR